MVAAMRINPGQTLHRVSSRMRTHWSFFQTSFKSRLISSFVCTAGRTLSRTVAKQNRNMHMPIKASTVIANW